MKATVHFFPCLERPGTSYLVTWNNLAKQVLWVAYEIQGKQWSGWAVWVRKEKNLSSNSFHIPKFGKTMYTQFWQQTTVYSIENPPVNLKPKTPTQPWMVFYWESKISCSRIPHNDPSMYLDSDHIIANHQVRVVQKVDNWSLTALFHWSYENDSFIGVKNWWKERSLPRAKQAAVCCQMTHQTWLECDTGPKPEKPNLPTKSFLASSRLQLVIR